MNVLIRGTSGSASENYADRILAALSVISYTHFRKNVLVLQLTDKLPIRQVMVGKIDQGNKVGSSFSFHEEGMEALWKHIRHGNISEDEWKDYTSMMYSDGLCVASCSHNMTEEFLREQDNLTKLLLSADDCFDLVYIFVSGSDTELVEILKGLEFNNKKLIDKEVVCVPQGYAVETGNRDKFYAVKNFDVDSVFTVTRMSREYASKNILPIPYNIGFKDACLERNARFFLNQNSDADVDSVNYAFIKGVASAVSLILGIREPVVKESNWGRRV